MSRARPLFDTAVNEATSALVPALEELTGKQVHRYVAKKIAEDTIRAYMAVAKDQEANRVKTRVSPTSTAMAGLEVGEAVVVGAQPFQTIRSRMTTARKIMENPDAKWKCEIVDNGIKITRTIDGHDYWRDPTKSDRAVELAGMEVGEKKLAKTIRSIKGHGQMGTNNKIAARKILDCPTANWRATTTPRGILIHRIA